MKQETSLEKEWKELQFLIHSARWGKGEDNDELYVAILLHNKKAIADQKAKMIQVVNAYFMETDVKLAIIKKLEKEFEEGV